MTTHSWGAAMARHRRIVIGIWLVGLIVCGAFLPYLFSQLKSPNYSVNGSESSHVATLLQQHFAGRGAEQDVIVLDTPTGRITDPAARTAVADVLSTARRQKGVVRVLGPFDQGARRQVSSDQHAAIAVLGLDGDTRDLSSRAKTLQDAITGASHGPVHAYLTGYSPITNDQTVVESADADRAESIGIPIALVVMVLAFGSFAAACLPLLMAVIGLITTFGAITVLTLGFSYDGFLLVIVTMIGMGIGIDYSMFIVSRFREELARRGVTRGDPRPDDVAGAAGAAIATSGRTIMYSGLIVATSVCSLYIVNSPVFREISTGVLVTVLCMLVAALTLLPALLGWLGPRVNAGSLPQRFRPADIRDAAGVEQGPWARWARWVMRRPRLIGSAAALVLIVLALPVLGLRYGIDLGTSSLGDRPSAQAQRVLDRSFGSGGISPVEVVVTGPNDTRLDPGGAGQVDALARTLSADDRVADVQVTRQSGRALLDVTPKYAIDSSRTSDLVRHIRQDPIGRTGRLDVSVGGATAEFVDLSQETTAKTPYVLLLVLGLSFVFLLFVFRSVLLPLKAVVLNLLATGAALGLTVAVFQDGRAESLFGFRSTGFLQVYLPVTVFVLLFGLSMDYEVFLIRRIKEARESGCDNETAIAVGVEHTARPITAAAAIMVAVFGSFLTAGILELKEFGLSLAAAVALDATLVRLVLVPVLMRLFGDWNWWLPGRGSRPTGATTLRAGSPAQRVAVEPGTRSSGDRDG